MKIFSKISIIMLAAALAAGLIGPIAANAATLPALGAAASFSILSQTTITGTGTISGNVGLNATGTGITALTTPMVTGTIYSTDGTGPSVASPFLSASVQADALAAYTTGIPSQPTNGTIVGNLDGQIFTPGVYDQGAITLGGGTVTLNGAGVYIFRSASTLTSSGTVNLIGGALPCNVFWRVQTSAAINGSGFVGTILSGTTIAFGANVTLNGRALGVGPAAAVTMLTDTISGPTCGVPATLTLVKTIVGGTRTFADFPLTATGPMAITGASGSAAVTNASVTAGTYTLSEGTQSDYTAGTWSCIKNTNPAVIGSSITLASGDSAVCTIQNNFITPGGAATYVPPLISVVKVPNPLALPAGPGPVTYTYTLKNIGTVPMSFITAVDNSCSPLTYVSGDTNGNSQLDVTETWTYTCTKTLPATQTNTVVATGWNTGISVTDIANATVVVGSPIVPPLIHVTKVPNPLVLPAAGGVVTYTKKVTNPGTVALSNVRLVDDKCSNVIYVSGDTNGDSKLDVAETWTYTCSVNLAQTTTNTVVATGDANGMTARDVAIATVVVAAPSLPNTGFPPADNNSLWIIVAMAGVIMLAITSLVLIRKKRTA